MIRTGIGYDVHKLEKGNNLVVGGIQIPSNYKSVGHSDGDTLIHAIIDSLLGAANLGDIGNYFPSEDEKWRGCSSDLFLKDIIQELKMNNYEIINIDSTIVLKKPIIGPYIDKIKQKLAPLMGISESHISVKATTTDGLGFVGKSEGWSALAIATIMKK
tara:strand:+ start:251 stop:727 length:477 start_codon:yes stop_codon:yes gene_type:complete